MNYPKASIIVVNWNGREYLGDCLGSVCNQSYENFKVILVDNGSTDGSVEFVRENYPGIEIIALDKNYGFTGGNNIGIKEAFRDAGVTYVALLNIDTQVEPLWLKELVRVAESDKGVGCCQSKMLSLTNPKLIDAVGIVFTKGGDPIQLGFGEEDVGQYNQIKEVFGACAGAALYKREMLDQIGLFDEDFFAYFEDVDLSLRVRLAGWKCMYVPSAVVWHKHGSSHPQDSLIVRFLCERNRYYFIIKNMPMDIVLKFLFKQPISIVSTTLKIIREKKFELLRCYLKASLEATRNILKMFRKRLKLRAISTVTALELRRQFT